MHSDKGYVILLLVMVVSFVEGNPNGLIEKEGIEGRNITFQVSIPLQEKEYNLTLMIGSKAAWTDVDWTPVFEYHLTDHSLNILDGKFIGRFDVQEYPSSGYLKVTLIHLKQSDDGQYRMRLFGPGLDRTIDEVFKIHVREDRCSYCPCFNGGSCSYDTIGDRVCSCPIDYSGGSCEISEKGWSLTEKFSLAVLVLVVFILLAVYCNPAIYLCKKRQKVKNWFSTRSLRVPGLGQRASYRTGNNGDDDVLWSISEKHKLIDENERNAQLLIEKEETIEVLEREKHDLDQNWRSEQSRCISIQNDYSNLQDELSEKIKDLNGSRTKIDDLKRDYSNQEKTLRATENGLFKVTAEYQRLLEEIGKRNYTDLIDLFEIKESVVPEARKIQLDDHSDDDVKRTQRGIIGEEREIVSYTPSASSSNRDSTIVAQPTESN